MRGNFGAIFLIVFGALALAHNLGYLNINLAYLLRVWWPVILIVLGVAFLFTPGGKRR
jgi:hypothetical protein